MRRARDAMAMMAMNGKFIVVLIWSLLYLGLIPAQYSSGGTWSTSISCALIPEMVCRPMRVNDDVIEMVPMPIPANHPIARQQQTACTVSYICTLPAQLPVDCEDRRSAGQSSSGVYTGYYTGSSSSSSRIYCDMETDGGGWLVFQRRINGTVDFYRNWTEYKNGFGEVDGEHWLGLEILHQLTSQKEYTLRVELEDWEGNTAYAEYDSFSISAELDNYTLTVGEYSGTAGDSLEHVNGYGFTTADVDHDYWEGENCAQRIKGAGWFRKCGHTNLNGLYLPESFSAETHRKGITWDGWKMNFHPLKKAAMKIRPH